MGAVQHHTKSGQTGKGRRVDAEWRPIHSPQIRAFPEIAVHDAHGCNQHGRMPAKVGQSANRWISRAEWIVASRSQLQNHSCPISYSRSVRVQASITQADAIISSAVRNSA